MQRVYRQAFGDWKRATPPCLCERGYRPLPILWEQAAQFRQTERMGIFDSLRKRPPAAPAQTAPVERGAGLQLLLSSPLSTDVAHLQTVLRAFDPSLRGAAVSGVGTTESPDEPGSFLGQVTWGAHHVEVVAFPFPMPAEVVEKCVQPAHYGDDDKERARKHGAHALLFYKGRATNKTEQYLAVALVTGALCGEGGLAILNESARTSLPASLFASDTGMKPSQFLRELPPLYLFAGFVKYNVEGVRGVWMRTHGLEEFELPNLATHAPSHEQGGEVFDIFSNVSSYMMAQGPVLEAGHTMQIGEDQFMRLRELSSDESVLDDGDALLVAEFISSDEANPHIFGSDKAH